MSFFEGNLFQKGVKNPQCLIVLGIFNVYIEYAPCVCFYFVTQRIS
jgi:hypothetical protein